MISIGTLYSTLVCYCVSCRPVQSTQQQQQQQRRRQIRLAPSRRQQQQYQRVTTILSRHHYGINGALKTRMFMAGRVN